MSFASAFPELERARIAPPLPPSTATNYYNLSTHPPGLNIRARVTLESPEPVRSEDFDTPEEYYRVQAIRNKYRMFTNAIAQWSEKNNVVLIIKYLELAIQYLRDNPEVFPDTCVRNDQISALYAESGRHLKNQNELAKSHHHLQMSLIYNPQNAITYNTLGIFFQLQKKFDKEEFCYLKAIELDPTYDSPHVQLGHFYKANVRSKKDILPLETAHTYYAKTVQINPKHADAHTGLGEIFLIKDNLKMAKVHLEEAIKLEPQKHSYQFNLAKYYLKEKNYLQARQLLQKLQAHPEQQLHPTAYQHQLAVIYLCEENYNECAALCRKVLKQKPNDLGVIINLISAQIYLNDIFGMLDSIELALQVKSDALPELLSFLYGMLAYLFFTHNYLEEAIQAYQTQIKHLPSADKINIAKTYTAMAYITLEQEKYDEAIAYYLHALEYCPYDTWVTSVIHAVHKLSLSKTREVKDVHEANKLALLEWHTENRTLFFPTPPLNLNPSWAQTIRFQNTIHENPKMGVHRYVLSKDPTTQLWMQKGTHPDARFKIANGLYNFVLLTHSDGVNRIIASRTTRHYYLARGQKDPLLGDIFGNSYGISVLFAGVVYIEQGAITHWDNGSGHYKPIAQVRSVEKYSKLTGFPLEKFFPEALFFKRLTSAIKTLGKKDYEQLRKAMGPVLPPSVKGGKALLEEYDVQL
jgi:tetratricopeptide (TPR) repeat protein